MCINIEKCVDHFQQKESEGLVFISLHVVLRCTDGIRVKHQHCQELCPNQIIVELK